jgi:hypothetical protein
VHQSRHVRAIPGRVLQTRGAETLIATTAEHLSGSVGERAPDARPPLLKDCQDNSKTLLHGAESAAHPRLAIPAQPRVHGSPADSMPHRHFGDGQAILERLQADPIALFHHAQLHKHELVPPIALSPCGRADWKEVGCVKHQADAPHTVKHLVDLRCQVSAGLLRSIAVKNVSATYALDCHNL